MLNKDCTMLTLLHHICYKVADSNYSSHFLLYIITYFPRPPSSCLVALTPVWVSICGPSCCGASRTISTSQPQSAAFWPTDHVEPPAGPISK